VTDQRQEQTMISLHRKLVEAGCEVSGHESDLYVLDTDLAREVIRKYSEEPYNGGLYMSQFTADDDHRQWLEFPFLFDPFWEKQANRKHS
jgi:hypothetical protein